MEASVVAAPGLWSTGSVAAVHGLSCSMVYKMFPDQGLNLGLNQGSFALASGFFTTEPPEKLPEATLPSKKKKTKTQFHKKL